MNRKSMHDVGRLTADTPNTTATGGNRRNDIDPAHLAALNTGTEQARTLTEALAIDHTALLAHVLPEAPRPLVYAVGQAQSLGILKRMTAIGTALHANLGPSAGNALMTHHSDTARGWACFTIGAGDHAPLAALVEAIRPLADDHHFTVREWAWMAVRPRLADDLDQAIPLLAAWTNEDSERLRRFASEALRPRGVWASHIKQLKEQPELGLPILDPLRADHSRYVQDSVANWINDAAKTRPDWAQELCTRWAAENPGPETRRITNRALRSLTRK